VPLKVFAGFGVLAALAMVALVMAEPYRAARITGFLDPSADALGGGYQALQGFYALASGGLWGVGLGNSAMKWDLLPHAQSDYIFAIIGEELGFLGCLVVVTLYGVLAYAGFRIARRVADRFIQLASVAITVWLIGQAAINMGYVVGLLPVTGVQLPLISAGGTSLVLTLFIVGLLARFARYEPAAIEAQRARTRGRLARWLLPVPSAAVEQVRPRRRTEARRPGPQVPGGRTVVAARGPRPAPGRGQPPRAEPRRAERPRAETDRRPGRSAERGAPPGERRVPATRRGASSADRRAREQGAPPARRQPPRGGR
jgi:cell division protein FtsW